MDGAGLMGLLPLIGIVVLAVVLIGGNRPGRKPRGTASRGVGKHARAALREDRMRERADDSSDSSGGGD